jgi:hypothetical protein
MSIVSWHQAGFLPRSLEQENLGRTTIIPPHLQRARDNILNSTAFCKEEVY